METIASQVMKTIATPIKSPRIGSRTDRLSQLPITAGRMATHNLSVVRYWSSYVILLQEGWVVFCGTPQELLTNQSVLDKTGLSRVWWKVDPSYS